MSTKGLNDFVWYDLQTPDPKAAIGFYSKLFGWTPQGEPDSGHVGWHNGENHFGGIGKPHAGAPAHWLGYIETDALEGTVERAKKMGAEVFAGPMSIGEGGDIAVVADPQGAVIGLYQGGKGHEGWAPGSPRPVTSAGPSWAAPTSTARARSTVSASAGRRASRCPCPRASITCS